MITVRHPLRFCFLHMRMFIQHSYTYRKTLCSERVICNYCLFFFLAPEPQLGPREHSKFPRMGASEHIALEHVVTLPLSALTKRWTLAIYLLPLVSVELFQFAQLFAYTHL